MKTIISNIRNISFALVSLIALSACGQKGPLVLEEIPIDATQAPLESAIDAIPVETPSVAVPTSEQNGSDSTNDNNDS